MLLLGEVLAPIISTLVHLNSTAVSSLEIRIVICENCRSRIVDHLL